MLYFFNEADLHDLLRRKDFQPFNVPRLDYTMGSLDSYAELWERCLNPYLQELDRKIHNIERLTLVETDDMNFLGRLETILPHLKSTVDFAREIGLWENLSNRFKYLEEYGSDSTRCHLYKDFAPYSFSFLMEREQGGEYVTWFNGGLIYHGSHDRGGDGGAPTFSANLTPQDGWSVHT